MAFRTNKVPAIEERTVSGSSVSFNSAFALPLKACKVSFSATQAGSGDPSPSNPRAISGVSAIGLTANSTPISVSLGDARYGGELDVLTGILTINKAILTLQYQTVNIANINYIKADATDGYIASSLIYPSVGCDIQPATISSKLVFSNRAIWVATGAVNTFTINFSQIHINIDNSLLGITDPTQETTATAANKMESWLANNPIDVIIPVKEQTIQLSANELSSIIGNNTFSTDTGTLEITFSDDLQEKSASGAVATFNTALAMPLSSCNIAVNAWQEGSGDPSPDNVRPIHGFSEVNATRCGINLWDEQWVVGAINANGGINAFETSRRTTFFIPVVPNAKYRQVSPQNAYGGRIAYYDINQTLLLYSGNGVSGGTKTFTTPANCRYVRITFGSSYGTTYNNDISINYPSTDTDYHAYTGNTYTIQFGQEVYGAEVDVVNGVAHVTHQIVDLGSKTWTKSANYNRFSSALPEAEKFPNLYGEGGTNISDIKCSIFKATSGDYGYNGRDDYRISGSFWNGINYLQVNDSDYSDANSFKTAMSGIYAVYKLAEPFDIQLTPTQIETIAGKTNTIFADTGNIDLTYKDLDIAKRGNFREVFKLPS